jgi:hypothetical protein
VKDPKGFENPSGLSGVGRKGKRKGKTGSRKDAKNGKE